MAVKESRVRSWALPWASSPGPWLAETNLEPEMSHWPPTSPPPSLCSLEGETRGKRMGVSTGKSRRSKIISYCDTFRIMLLNYRQTQIQNGLQIVVLNFHSAEYFSSKLFRLKIVFCATEQQKSLIQLAQAPVLVSHAWNNQWSVGQFEISLLLLTSLPHSTFW